MVHIWYTYGALSWYTHGRHTVQTAHTQYIHGTHATLSFDKHIKTVVKSCNYHLRALRHIRRCITQDIASIIACSIVESRIDYCNGLLFGASSKAFNRLQRVQNNLARAVFDIGIRNLHDSGRRSFDLLRELHWLPVQARVTYKVALLCFKCYKLGMPSADLLVIAARAV